MSELRVLSQGELRNARAGAFVSSGAILHLLGFASPKVTADDANVPAGDALASVARALGLKFDSPVVAWGHVRERAEGGLSIGSLEPDGALEDALAVLSTLAHDLLLVPDASTQEQSAAESLRRAVPSRSSWSVIGILSLGDACDRLLGFRARALAGSLVPEARRHAARVALFRETLVGSRLALEWHIVAALAQGLLQHVAEDDARAQFELAFVRSVARRHEGHASLLAWPDADDLAAYSLDDRLTVLAHVVQSASDGGSDCLNDYVRRALALVGADRSEGALKLRGALGRALAAAGDFAGASEVLRSTVEAWLNLEPSQSSWALCELLRVEGILGHASEVEELQRLADARIRGAIDSESSRYVDLAIGRALVQVGRHEAALKLLGGESLGGLAREHVQQSALRWRAAAALALGDEATARACEASLRALGASAQLRLAELDRGFASTEATMACLDAMRTHAADGKEVRALLARGAPGLSPRAIAESPELLRRLREEFRY